MLCSFLAVYRLTPLAAVPADAPAAEVRCKDGATNLHHNF